MIARKAYKCRICGITILKGDNYHRDRIGGWGNSRLEPVCSPDWLRRMGFLSPEQKAGKEVNDGTLVREG